MSLTLTLLLDVPVCPMDAKGLSDSETLDLIFVDGIWIKSEASST